MQNSWDELEHYRGTWIAGEWPTISEQLHLSAHKYPDAACFTAFSPSEITMTYTEVVGHVERTADYLITSGVNPGDRIALTGKNSPYWGIAYFAIIEAGAVVVPIDYQLDNASIERLISASEASVLFVDREKFDDLGSLRELTDQYSHLPRSRVAAVHPRSRCTELHQARTHRA